MSLIEIVLQIGTLAILLLGVGTYLPLERKWLKLILIGLAVILLQSAVFVGLELTREEGARARATRDSLWRHLEGLRADVDWVSAESVVDRSPPSPPLDGWGNEVRQERHEGHLVVWSYGQDGVRDFSKPPSSCLDRARPYHDVILGLEQTGKIRRLQVPGISGDPTCTRAPDQPQPKYVYPAMATQAVLVLVFLRRLWSQMQQLRQQRAAAGNGVVPASLRQDLAVDQLFQWKYRTVHYSAIVSGVTLAATVLIILPRALAASDADSLIGSIAASLPTSPWLIVSVSVIALVWFLRILPSEVRFERSGEVKLAGIIGGEKIPANEELKVRTGIPGLFFVGKRSCLVMPFFERPDQLADILEGRKPSDSPGA